MLDVLAIEVTASVLRCLRVAGIGRTRAVRAYSEHPVPSGLVVPSSNLPNVRDEPAFSHALAKAVGSRPPRRARLVLPDRSVRLHILNTDAVRPGELDLRQFLVWRLQDALPFESREARVAYLTAPNGLPERRMAITLVAREQVVAQYERLLRGVGTGVAHAAPAACHLFNLAGFEAGPAGREVEAFLALGIEAATLLVLLGGVPHYARTFLRPAHAPAPGSRPPASGPAPTAVPELVSELARSFHHAEEEEGLARPSLLCLAGEMGHDRDLAAALQKGLGIPSALLSAASVRAVRGAGLLPPAAHAVLSAALARI
jgi:Tfp pilus assembly PilM family ATPase